MPKATLKHKLALMGLYGVAYYFLYTLPNLTLYHTASYLPLTWIDHAVPLIPWTFLVYTSDYLLALIVIILIQDKERFNSLARMAFGVLIACGAFFWFFPTVYPRPVYPDLHQPWLQNLLTFVSTYDTPGNCFPSHHIAVTAICTWCVRSFGRRTQMVFILWALLVFASTLTTKQHYVIDIVGGMGVAFAVIFAHRFLYERVAVKPPIH